MSEQFNPRAAVKSIRRGTGAFQYMQVKDRVQWFRTDHPEGVIQSELVRWDAEFGVAVVLATVTAPGLGVAQALGSACRKDLEGKVAAKQAQPDQVESYVEFAETAAVGRALGRLGYGTEDALDVTPVDSPHEQTPAPQEQQARQQPQDARPRPQAAPNAPMPIRAASVPAGAVTESANGTPARINAEDKAKIRKALDDLGWGGRDKTNYLKQYGVAYFSELSAEQAAVVVPDLEAKARKVQALAHVP